MVIAGKAEILRSINAMNAALVQQVLSPQLTKRTRADIMLAVLTMRFIPGD
jgi:hypothetical protein